MVNALGARQRWAFLLAGASAVAATSLCGFSWLPVLLGTAAAMAVCLVLDEKLRPCGAALALCHGGIFRRLLAAATLAFTVVALAWAANLAGEAFPTAGGSPVLGWTLLALAAWGSYKEAPPAPPLRGCCASCSWRSTAWWPGSPCRRSPFQT